MVLNFDKRESGIYHFFFPSVFIDHLKGMEIQRQRYPGSVFETDPKLQNEDRRHSVLCHAGDGSQQA